MGCQACKVPSYDGFSWMLESQKNLQSSQEIKGLLKKNQMKVWEDNLKIIQAPDRNFWDLNKQMYHTCFIQIKKDLPRSFPDCKFFSIPKNMMRFQILLKKFALYFPKMGYTQGLNFLAGYILLAGFNDAQSFQILVSLVLHEKLLLIGLYQDRFPLNRLYCSVFWNLMDKKMPRTAKIIKNAGVPDEIWIFQWFMSFFLYSFPLDFVKPFFNYVICKKQLSIVFIALGIINCLKPEISALVNPDQYDFFQFINNLKDIKYCNQKINIQKVINYANSITNFQIQTALNQVKVERNNIYHIYFWKQDKQREIWNALYNKTIHQRKMFQFDPKSMEYRRDRDMVQHLQRLILKKCKLYKSRAESKFSNSFKTSNYTIEIENQELQSYSHSQQMSQKIMGMTLTGTGTVYGNKEEEKSRSKWSILSRKKQVINLKQHNRNRKNLSGQREL